MMADVALASAVISSALREEWDREMYQGRRCDDDPGVGIGGREERGGETGWGGWSKAGRRAEKTGVLRQEGGTGTTYASSS